MRKKSLITAAILGVILAGVGAWPLAGQTRDTTTISEIRKELLQLPYYGVFDFLAFSYERGTVTIDAGARNALHAGRSLLPAGVVKVDGAFDRGDAVIIRDADGRELGRGLIAYARADAERLIGRKSAEIESLLGYRGRTEMIHRDDMALNRSG